MKKKILSFVAIAMLFAACSSEEPNPPPEAENIPQVANPYRVSLDDALDNAETLLSQISEAETRSGRRVASVKYFTTPSTRSADSDTMLYLVNYENDGGFALLSADSRLRPVYAISDEGSLNMEDTVYNKGLAMFARGVEAEIASIILPPVDRDTTVILPPSPLYTDTIVTQKKVGPLLNPHQLNWSQNAPFNTYCFTDDGDQSVVGCVAIAVGQIMAYHQWPLNYNDLTLNWSAINSGNDIDSLAKFLHVLGNDDNLRMRYEKNGGYAVHTRIYPTLDNFGYTYNNFTSFSEADICSYLEGIYSTQYVASPIIVVGAHYVSGHAWVIDGYLKYSYTKYVGSNTTTWDDPVLYHNVWGWGGKNNGYYYYSYNDLDGDDVDDGRYGFTPDIIEKDELDTSNDAPYDFTEYYNCIYMAGFIPQRQ